MALPRRQTPQAETNQGSLSFTVNVREVCLKTTPQDNEHTDYMYVVALYKTRTLLSVQTSTLGPVRVCLYILNDNTLQQQSRPPSLRFQALCSHQAPLSLRNSAHMLQQLSVPSRFSVCESVSS